MRKLLSCIALAMLFVGPAYADQKSDAQAKVDAAKVDVCEKGKKFLADQEAKGRCKAESDEAKKITCTAATSKQVNDLLTKCTSAKPADAKADPKADAKADPKAEPAATDVPKCRALDVADPKTVIVEAEDKLTTKCTRLLIEALQKKWCTAENKGKKFDYMTDFDHMIGTGKFAKKVAGKKQSLTCHTVAK